MRAYNANQAGLGWLNPDERSNKDNVQTDKEGKITINGKPYNANDPTHVKAYRDFLTASDQSSAVTPPPAATTPAVATAPDATTAQSAAPAANAPKPAATTPKPGAPKAQPSGVVAALIKLGYSPQGAAAMAAKIPPGTSEQDAIKLALAGKLNESLSWSRGFDPSQTLYNKMKSQR